VGVKLAKIMIFDPGNLSEKTKIGGSLKHHLPKLGLLYVASSLERAGHDILFQDLGANYKSNKDFINLLKDQKPKYLCCSVVVTEWPNAKRILKLVKKHLPNLVIIVGGPQPTAIREKTLSECQEIDYVVLGEGEITIVDLLDALENNKDPHFVEGILYKQEDKYIFTEDRKFVHDLDSLSIPAWHFLDFQKYSMSVAGKFKRGNDGYIITSRGCPYTCIFCDKSVFKHRYRSRSAENIIEEIEMLVKKYGVKNIMFFDDLFTLDKQRVKKICDLIKTKKLDFAWTCQARLDSVDEDLLKNMASAGCMQIGYGVETGSERLQKFIRKNIDFNYAKKIIKLTKNLGIETKGFFMLGFPTETKEEMNTTIDLAIELDLDIAVFSLVTPYPGTDLYILIENQMIGKDWSKFSPLGSSNLVYVPETMTKKELLKIYKKAFIKFYLRPTYLLKKLLSVLKHPYYAERYFSVIKPLFKSIK